LSRACLGKMIVLYINGSKMPFFAGASAAYESSVECSVEARWAASQIDCIPLMMQGAFRPNAKGWLGVLLGSRVWYAFWACRELEDEAKFEQRVDAVAREIGLRGRRQRTRKKTTPQVEGSTGMPNQQVLKVENQVTEAERGLNAEMPVDAVSEPDLESEPEPAQVFIYNEPELEHTTEVDQEEEEDDGLPPSPEPPEPSNIFTMLSPPPPVHPQSSAVVSKPRRDDAWSRAAQTAGETAAAPPSTPDASVTAAAAAAVARPTAAESPSVLARRLGQHLEDEVDKQRREIEQLHREAAEARAQAQLVVEAEAAACERAARAARAAAELELEQAVEEAEMQGRARKAAMAELSNLRALQLKGLPETPEWGSSSNYSPSMLHDDDDETLEAAGAGAAGATASSSSMSVSTSLFSPEQEQLLLATVRRELHQLQLPQSDERTPPAWVASGGRLRGVALPRQEEEHTAAGHTTVSTEQLASLQARLEALHRAQLISSPARESIEDALADFIEMSSGIGHEVTAEHVMSSPVAAKARKIVALSEGVRSDGVFARQIRRKSRA
jgi:hypothetical protein